MARHFRLHRIPRRGRAAHAVHVCRGHSARHRHRLISRSEHDQHQKPGGGAEECLHFVKRIADFSSRFPVLRQPGKRELGNAHGDVPIEECLLTTQLIYHSFIPRLPMHPLAQQFAQSLRRRRSIRAGDRVAAAVSGGADSVALLLLLLEARAELGMVLSVAHVNHQLRGEESDGDERFVADLARRHGLELHVCAAPLEKVAARRSGTEASGIEGSGIEAGARELRYGFFRQLAREGRVNKIATAHTLDDQAETVLLRIFRGTGIRGLAGIHPRIVFAQDVFPERLSEGGKAGGVGEVFRPLLGFRRASLREFLREQGQEWREDSSNHQLAFLRNRLRHGILTRIVEEFGDAALEHLSDLAEIARAEEEHWGLHQGHAEVDVKIRSAGEIGKRQTETASSPAALHVGPLLALSLAAQRRMVRGWLDANSRHPRPSFRQIEKVLELARGEFGEPRRIELPGGQSLHYAENASGKHGGDGPALVLQSAARNDLRAVDYEYALPLPGSVEVPELRACFEARLTDPWKIPENERGQLLDATRLPPQIVIRNWRPGDRYRPAHTSAPRKVKALLTARHASGADKKLWPVAFAEGCGLVWMRGFAVPTAFQAANSAANAICIRELPR